jgi:hypothetical protein
MEAKVFCLHKTAGANNDIKQCDTVFFARNPISVTHNQLVAMLTNGIHDFPERQRTCHFRLMVIGGEDSDYQITEGFLSLVKIL